MTDTMVTINKWAWQHLILPLLVVSIVGSVGFAIRAESKWAAMAEQLHGHKELEAHPNTRQQQIDLLKGEVKAIQAKIDGLVREQRQVNQSLKEELNYKFQTILDRIGELKKQQPR